MNAMRAAVGRPARARLALGAGGELRRLAGARRTARQTCVMRLFACQSASERRKTICVAVRRQLRIGQARHVDQVDGGHRPRRPRIAGGGDGGLAPAGERRPRPRRRGASAGRGDGGARGRRQSSPGRQVRPGSAAARSARNARKRRMRSALRPASRRRLAGARTHVDPAAGRVRHDAHDDVVDPAEQERRVGRLEAPEIAEADVLREHRPALRPRRVGGHRQHARRRRGDDQRTQIADTRRAAGGRRLARRSPRSWPAAPAAWRRRRSAAGCRGRWSRRGSAAAERAAIQVRSGSAAAAMATAMTTAARAQPGPERRIAGRPAPRPRPRAGRRRGRSLRRRRRARARRGRRPAEHRGRDGQASEQQPSLERP